MEIELGRECDVDNWMQLVNKVKDSFPGLETKEALEEHRHTVLGFMRKGSAICARVNDQIVGALLFSREDSMLSLMNEKRDVVVTTYREGVPEGIAARAFYKRLGFVEGKLTEEFVSPVQELILKR